MDPITALGLAAAVVQFVQVGVQVTNTLIEYINANPGDVPKTLEDITIQLPLIVKALSSIKSESSLARYDPETRMILHGVVLGCLRLARELDDIAKKISPKPGESLSGKLKKVLHNLKNENRVTEIDRGLQAYIQVLVLHQVVNPADVQAVPASDVVFFEVKEKRMDKPLPQQVAMTQLHEAFSQAARMQRQTPQLVVLEGKEGSGKTQLALEYCCEAHKLGHFRVVFWLDASSPASLERGMGSLASTIRKTKTGSQEEKLDFVFKFLTDLWQPWLIVLDNYQHKAYEDQTLLGLLPNEGYGAVLLLARDAAGLDVKTVIKVYRPLNAVEDKELRSSITQALYNRKIDPIIDALSENLDVNSYSSTWNDDKHQPMINLAATIGFDDALQLFLDTGADPHKDSLQGPALSKAAYHGQVSAVNILLDHEDQTGYRLDKNDYSLAFSHAMDKDDDCMLKMLINRRGDFFDPASRWGENAFPAAAAAGRLENMKRMARHFPISGRTRGRVLESAIKGRQIEVLKYLLTGLRLNPNLFNESRQHPLVVAMDICRDKAENEIRDSIITMLLEAGASPNAEGTYDNNSPLHMAATHDLPSSIELLLKAGADPSPLNWKEETVLERAIEWERVSCYDILTSVKLSDPAKHGRYYGRAMLLAAKKGDRELMLQILKQGDINTVDKSSGRSALLVAIKKNHVPLARMLVRYGACQDIVDNDGDNALLSAAGQGMHLLIKDLAKGKDSVGLETQDAKSYTPLMRAVRRNHEDAVKTLLSLGADKEAMNKFGETALDIAEEGRFEKLIKLLEGFQSV